MICMERVLSHRSAACSSAVIEPSCLRYRRHKTPPLLVSHNWKSRQRQVVVCSKKDRENVATSAAYAQTVPTVDNTSVPPPSPVLEPGISGYSSEDVTVPAGDVITRFIAETLLPTRHGNFRLRGYKHSIDGGLTFTEPAVIICGSVENAENVPVRVHDACFTSEVLGSLKCDCAEQLALSLDIISAHAPGMVIYLQQEGRGIGLANKIAAYSLQEQGLDTVDANRALGLPDDCREYTSVRNILKELNVRSIQLITNNPRKINQLTALGIRVNGRVPCVVRANELNQSYLDTKRERMDHMLEGQYCFWNHDGEPAQPAPTVAAKGGMGVPRGLRAGLNGRIVIDPAPRAASKANGSRGDPAE